MSDYLPRGLSRHNRNKAKQQSKKSSSAVQGLGVFLMGMVLGCMLALTAIGPSVFFRDNHNNQQNCHALDNHQNKVDVSSLPDATTAAATITTTTTAPNWNDKSNGWSLIHVFYGTRDHLPQIATIKRPKVMQCNTWFAQAKQDELVYHLLHQKRNGYFVDIAANDAVRLSNTYALETHFNWNGICIEANPHYWPGLSYRNCHVVGAVVANDRETVHFRFSNKEYGGIVGDQFDNKHTHREQPRMTVTLIEVLQRMASPDIIDYMSLDVEGAEDLVLQPNVLQQYQFNLLTIERPSDPMKQLLDANGYKLLKVLTEFNETMFVRRAIEHELNHTALERIDTWHYQNDKSC